jgi:hypothetical protein
MPKGKPYGPSGKPKRKKEVVEVFVPKKPKA